MVRPWGICLRRQENSRVALQAEIGGPVFLLEDWFMALWAVGGLTSRSQHISGGGQGRRGYCGMWSGTGLAQFVWPAENGGELV